MTAKSIVHNLLDAHERELGQWHLVTLANERGFVVIREPEDIILDSCGELTWRHATTMEGAEQLIRMEAMETIIRMLRPDYVEEKES